MKKISVLIAFLFSSSSLFAQLVKQGIGNVNSIVTGANALKSDSGYVNAVYIDTAHANLNKISHYPSAQIAVGNEMWIRNITATKWLHIGTGIGDTTIVYVADDLYVVDSLGHQVIHRFHNDGLVSGGVVTRSACLSLDVTPAAWYKNFLLYGSLATTLTVPPADPSLPRTDEIIGDTLGNITLRTGTPSSTPVAAPVNPSSEIVLATYTLAAAASCVGIISETVYDENTEWATSHTGTMTVSFVNTANPFHLTNACFISTYTDGSSIVFTRTGNDTAQVNEILKFFVYTNGAFLNQFQVSIWNGSTQVGNTVTFNSGFGFNPNDSNVYQFPSIPFSAFNLTNQIFNKIVIKFAGNDISGAKGLYIDFVQLQTGINNFGTGRGVLNITKNITGDSVITTLENGTTFTVFDRGSNISLTTTGSGAATLISNVLNIPTPSIPAQFNPIAGTNVTISGSYPNITFNASPGGAGSVTSVAALTLGTTGTDLSSTVANSTTTPVITLNVPTASATNRGALSSTDWNTFNGKQPQLNGTGFVKATGTTISYDNSTYLTTVDTTNIANFSVKVRSLFSATSPVTYVNGVIALGTVPIANGGTNNASLSVTAGTIYYGDGTKLIGLAPGNANQVLHSGTTPVWKDTTAAGTGGITRNISSTATSAAAGSTANTDYVIYVSGASTITMPTAVGNTNRYTIMRTGTSTVAITTTSSQTINGAAAPLNLIVQYASVDLMSNGSNWFIH